MNEFRCIDSIFNTLRAQGIAQDVSSSKRLWDRRFLVVLGQVTMQALARHTSFVIW